MATINWQPSTQKDIPSTSASQTSSTSNPLVVSLPCRQAGSSNPWFAISLGLMGIIIGFSIGKWRIGDFPLLAGAPPDQVAQAPVPSPLPPPPQAPSGPVPPIDVKTDHIRGDLKKAQVAVIEYSDFECPFCKRVHPTYQQIMQTYGDKVVWVYRHYPLPFHPNAEPAAIASECANDLGESDAFWKFTDKIFETQGEWAYEKYAADLGLDAKKFKDCIASGKFKQHVQDDMNGGSAAGVNGTPGNFVMNLKTQKSQEVSGAQPFESFKSAIDAALQG
ncbi:thioredoxin domain-containing protein [Candidatus Peregrinibacteria bacterium]|nr:thioredoxin domain-containing protein [Candidatus Peregrinibacteria bacterium]